MMTIHIRLVYVVLIVFWVGLSACSEIEMIQVDRLSDSELTRKFENRKGSMRPVEGYTTTHYPEPPLWFIGTPTNRQTYTGENILHARAVSSGKVARVRDIATMGIAIIVKHGMYLTVYTNVDKALVAEGDWVSTGGYLGEGNPVNDETNELGFQLFRGTEDLDPKDWIGK